MNRNANDANDTNANAFTSDAQRQRRDAYDAAMRDMPLTLALRAHRVPPPHVSAFGRPVLRVARVTRLQTGPNAWETRGPHLRTHLTPDRECHHPLVNCAHK